MLKATLTLVMAMLCLNFTSKAQQPNKPPLKHQAITGKVISASTGEALPGAVIKISNTGQTVLTSNIGAFTLNLANGSYNLSVHYLSYQPTSIHIQVPLNEPLLIRLQAEENELDEIQIIGYGQTTRRLSTGSISTITAKQIEQQPVSNVLSALSGRMPGVFVQTTNGLPGGNINIQIRGKGSLLAGTNPLYIIDGMPYDGSSPNTGGHASADISGNISPLNNINPSDIESITVLKDADATSVYGSRGANGVVLITTKRNNSSSTSFNVNLQHGISEVAKRPRVLDLAAYLQLRREAFSNNGLTPSADPLSASYAPDLTIWSQTEATDWVDYLIGGTSNSTDLQAKLTGGNQHTTFAVSGNYRHDNTVLPGKNNYIRSGLLAQVQHRSKDNRFNLAVSNSFSYQYSDLVNPTINLASSFLIAPNYPAYLPDGSFNWYSNTNLFAEIGSRSKSDIDNSITNLNLSYHLLPALSFKINSGYTRAGYKQTQIFPKSAIPASTINYTNFVENSSQALLIEPQIDYQLKIRSAMVSFTIGSTYQTRSNAGQFIKASNFSAESLMENLASGATIDSRSNTSAIYKYLSAFGRATFNLANTYILNATLRRDGSSRFGPGNRYGNFGAVGTAFLFSNLTVVKKHLPWLSHGKIRASYGTSGNDQIPDYQYLSTYSSPGANIYQGIATTRPSRISNADYHWETTHKTDIALELGLLNDKLFLSAEYYTHRSKDQLVSYALPLMTGFSSYQANIPAVIENKGWEISANAKLIQKEKFSWSGHFNLTFPVNRLVSFENFKTSSYATGYELGYDITRITLSALRDATNIR